LTPRQRLGHPRCDKSRKEVFAVHCIRSLAAAVIFCLTAAHGLADDAATLRLADDFELDDFAPDGGLYYKDNFEQSAGTVTFQSDDVRHGKGALQLTLVPICPAARSGCSERAEVWERSEVLARYDSPLWYGFSMKLADPIPADDHRYLMAQWKRQILPGAQKAYSPFLALRLDKGKLIMTIDSDSLSVVPLGSEGRETDCLPGEAPVNHRPHDGQTRALVAFEAGMPVADWRYVNGCTSDLEVIRHAPGLPAANSGWIDFAFFIQTGPEGDGRIEILANDRWIASVKGRIGHGGEGLGDNQYFKFGPYRAAHDSKWSVLYDRFRRGPGCEHVASETACNTVELAAR
jgi:hypothetical protein